MPDRHCCRVSAYGLASYFDIADICRASGSAACRVACLTPEPAGKYPARVIFVPVVKTCACCCERACVPVAAVVLL